MSTYIVKSEFMVVVKGINYYGGQKVELTDTQAEFIKGKLVFPEKKKKLKVENTNTESKKEDT